MQTWPFFPLRGNYSGCVAWRQQSPPAQLVCNTTQVAVNPLAPRPTFLPASPKQWRDRNQTNRNLLEVYLSGMENKAMFSLSLCYCCKNEEKRPGAVLSLGCLIEFKTWGTQDKWPLTCLSFFSLISFFLFSDTRVRRFRALQHLLSSKHNKVYNQNVWQQVIRIWLLPNLMFACDQNDALDMNKSI